MPPRTPPPTDLGPVAFRVEFAHEPRTAADRATLAPPEADDGPLGGPLQQLAAVHARFYRGKCTMHLGDSIPIKLKTHVDLDAIEELFVMLLELVDGGVGEWSLTDKSELLIVEAEALGPDVTLEFGDGDDGPGVFRKVRFPQRATVRLRALVEECAKLIRRLIMEASVADPEFGASTALDELKADLAELVDAVAHHPLEFRAKSLPVVAAL